MDGKKETRKGNPIIKLGSCYEMRIMTVFTTTKLLPSMSLAIPQVRIYGTEQLMMTFVIKTLISRQSAPEMKIVRMGQQTSH
jgi:hypothetical protein